MSNRFPDNFDYENARRDIFDAGGDPDYLSDLDPAKRDAFMRKMGMDPKRYGSKWGQHQGTENSSSGSGCFLTSACAEARGLPDDCEELVILRQYRDGYLRNRKDGEKDIRLYYAIAPQIVSRINAKENAKEIWDKVYEEMVLPCVRMIKTNKMEAAYAQYKSYTQWLTQM